MDSKTGCELPCLEIEVFRRHLIVDRIHFGVVGLQHGRFSFLSILLSGKMDDHIFVRVGAAWQCLLQILCQLWFLWMHHGSV